VIEPASSELYRATADALHVLGTAAPIIRALTSDEIHCICYFGRTMANSLAELDGPAEGEYAFTYGTRGGPYSNELQTALENLVLGGIVYRHQVIADDETAFDTYSADEGVIELAMDMEEGSADPGNAVPFIVAIVRSLLVRPVPAVYNAIHREPSLLEARLQELRIGLPLPTRNELLGTWLAAVANAIDRLCPGRGREPELLVPVALDALQAPDVSGTASHDEGEHDGEPEDEEGHGDVAID
jgi:hypothetical protein